MKAKNQRLALALVSVGAIVGAAMLAMNGLKDKAAYFYTPSEIATKGVVPGKAIRLGGMVVDKSIRRLGDGTLVHFVVADAKRQVAVSFKGITPDLFKEKSGVIAEGSLNSDGSFTATNLLAKHDEKYMPPDMAKLTGTQMPAKNKVAR